MANPEKIGADAMMVMQDNSQLLTVDLPASLFDWLAVRARWDGLSRNAAMSRLLEGLPALPVGDLESLAKPGKEPRRTVHICVSKSAIRALEEASCKSRLSRSLICSKLLHGVLVSQQLRVIWDPGLKDFVLQLTQLQFDFAQKS